MFHLHSVFLPDSSISWRDTFGLKVKVLAKAAPQFSLWSWAWLKIPIFATSKGYCPQSEQAKACRRTSFRRRFGIREVCRLKLRWVLPSSWICACTLENIVNVKCQVEEENFSDSRNFDISGLEQKTVSEILLQIGCGFTELLQFLVRQFYWRVYLIWKSVVRY